MGERLLAAGKASGPRVAVSGLESWSWESSEQQRKAGGEAEPGGRKGLPDWSLVRDLGPSGRKGILEAPR